MNEADLLLKSNALLCVIQSLFYSFPQVQSTVCLQTITQCISLMHTIIGLASNEITFKIT